jgi:hypothetical protein
VSALRWTVECRNRRVIRLRSAPDSADRLRLRNLTCLESTPSGVCGVPYLFLKIH